MVDGYSAAFANTVVAIPGDHELPTIAAVLPLLVIAKLRQSNHLGELTVSLGLVKSQTEERSVHQD